MCVSCVRTESNHRNLCRDCEHDQQQVDRHYDGGTCERCGERGYVLFDCIGCGFESKFHGSLRWEGKSERHYLNFDGGHEGVLKLFDDHNEECGNDFYMDIE